MLSIIHKKHKDRYRTIFCDADFYANNQAIFKLWKTRFSELSAVDKVQAWVIGLSCLRRPKDWYSGRRAKAFINHSDIQQSLKLQDIFKDTPISYSPKLPENINIFDFLNEYKIKALPEACVKSLCFTSSKRYPLIITNNVPTPQELLKIQISGKRIISFNEDYTTWANTLYNQRDFLGFIIHDLIHADHFFYHAAHHDRQLGFYRFIEKILSTESLLELLKNPVFNTSFEYIISDMNSHPLHLFQTLHAALFINLKNDNEASKIWAQWATKLNTDASSFQALLKINTKEFTHQHALMIEKICLELAQA